MTNDNNPNHPNQPSYGDQQGQPSYPGQGGAQQSYGSAPQSYNPGPNETSDGSKPPSKAMAITGFVLSFFGLLAIVGLVLNIISYKRFGRAGQPRGLSLAGIIISIVVIIITIVGIIVAIAGFTALIQQCADLGPGTHVVDGVTYTCS
jgi:hypothetical protein